MVTVHSLSLTTVRIQKARLLRYSVASTSMVQSGQRKPRKILVPGKKVVVSGTLLDYNGTKEIKGGNLISIK